MPHPLVANIRRRDPDLASSLARDLTVVEWILFRVAGSISEPLMARAATYLVASGGTRLRPLLALLSARFGEVRRDDLCSAAALVELGHMATLCHDDVMDGAHVRRGVPSINARWGSQVAVLTGDRLLASAGLISVELGEEVFRGHADVLHRLVRGQVAETVGAGPEDDSTEHYRTVVADKTAALLEFATWLGATVTGADAAIVDQLVRYAAALGIAFQIRDDLRDLVSSEVTGKAAGADLREGVRTLPVLYALADDGPSGRRLRDLVADGPVTDDDSHREAVTLLSRSPALPRVRVELHRQVARARGHLDRLPAVPARAALGVVCDHVLDDGH